MAGPPSAARNGMAGVKRWLEEFDIISEVTTCSKCTNNIVQGIVTSREKEKKDERRK